MTVPDEELFAFVDGELPPEAMARIEAAMASDPQLALRIETQRALRRLLAGPHAAEGAAAPRRATTHRDPTLAPPPKTAPKPAEVIAFPGAKAKAKPKIATKPQPVGPGKPARAVGGSRRAPPVWMLVAGALLGGIALDRLVIPPSPTLSGATEAPLLAAGPLARVLGAQATGQAAGPVRVSLSFKDKAGLYCRAFQASGPTPVAGIACREPAGWRLRMTTSAAPTASAAVRPPAPESSAVVLAAVNAMIAGPPLDAAGEARARKAGWRVR